MKCQPNCLIGNKMSGKIETGCYFDLSEYLCWQKYRKAFSSLYKKSIGETSCWKEKNYSLNRTTVFVFGFYLMSRLDRFLEENRKALLKENESCEPSKVLLPHGLSESEILCEIRRFRETHGNVDIILSDGQKNDF